MDNINYEMEALDTIIEKINKELIINEGFSGYVEGLEFARDMIIERYNFLESINKTNGE